MSEQPNRFQRDIDHWNETGKCLRHFALDEPPLFCEQCGKPWRAVLDGREGRKNRQEREVQKDLANARRRGRDKSLLSKIRKGKQAAAMPTPVGRWVAHVNKTDTCWLWTAVLDSFGYGHMRIRGRFVRAHRFSYELHVGPIPEGMELDHLCRVRNCVNPAHLEPVTRSENIRRSWQHRPRAVSQ